MLVRLQLAGAPGVSEALFILRLETLAAERGRLGAENLVYTCSVCHKEYRSSKAHAQHLRSKLHIQKASIWSKSSSGPITVTKPVPHGVVENSDEGLTSAPYSDCNVNSSDEWEEVNDDDDVLSLNSDELDGIDQGQRVEAGISNHEDLDYWNATQCFFCDSIPDGSIGGCVQHMHQQHGFFLPDAEYLSDPQGLLSYLGMKVTKDFMCLYCEGHGKQFSSLEAVRKHMISKSHCKLRYGDEDQEEGLDNFYDFTSSYLPEEDAQLVSEEEFTASLVSLSASGEELIIKHAAGRKQGIKTVGAREFLKYYKQKPRPSDMYDGTLVNSLVSRYRRMGLSTKQTRDGFCNRKETKKAAHYQAHMMRMKLGIKNNILKNLPRNVLY
ncbi:hypothetical protein GOP47_0021462 [Adiantum capillus-veneris]|uniref:C2H2-type domain-containing protein n=1 Tax=Adiantum capillus-veneris TaxID=13818 RepID=A0A9D4U7S2_ADICA|nr:hypothetical protein GOP47_0021462 [Adiantum capillus-veneris]